MAGLVKSNARISVIPAEAEIQGDGDLEPGQSHLIIDGFVPSSNVIVEPIEAHLPGPRFPPSLGTSSAQAG